MKLSLVVLIPGSSNGKTIPITRSPFVIGRDPKCHLRPSSALVSNRHCAIQVRDGKVYVSDLGSTNGTQVNDQPVKKECEVQNDDRLQIGPLLFGVRIQKTISVDQPTPLPPTKTPVPAPSQDEDAVAAVLLSMQDDGTSNGQASVDSTGVPTGGTEILKTQDIQLPAVETTVGAAAPTVAENKDPKEQKADKPKPPQVNTAKVAEDLLKKYLRRPRKV